jgi:hypothetical protein
VQPLVCDVAAISGADLRTLDVLARLELISRRLGTRVELTGACPELREWIAFAGLGDVLGCAESDLESRRQAEKRKHAGRVEEERDAADPAP